MSTDATNGESAAEREYAFTVLLDPDPDEGGYTPSSLPSPCAWWRDGERRGADGRAARLAPGDALRPGRRGAGGGAAARLAAVSRELKSLTASLGIVLSRALASTARLPTTPRGTGAGWRGSTILSRGSWPSLHSHGCLSSVRVASLEAPVPRAPAGGDTIGAVRARPVSDGLHHVDERAA